MGGREQTGLTLSPPAASPSGTWPTLLSLGFFIHLMGPQCLPQRSVVRTEGNSTGGVPWLWTSQPLGKWMFITWGGGGVQSPNPLTSHSQTPSLPVTIDSKHPQILPELGSSGLPEALFSRVGRLHSPVSPWAQTTPSSGEDTGLPRWWQFSSGDRVCPQEVSENS